ncbi:hypothetical protein AV530_003824 [Patagioenas fasciata monilis]|uniref:Uncharacterized protein n=1 Tax=Patagioenas fasciata monilis TaxID=372326 RepID=A0A1V4KYZ0_PATFA|nr:hypothetical protein AV530_003824 [Patagioenas fasciata monilis]
MRRIQVWESEAAVSCNKEALRSPCVSSVQCCHRAVIKQRFLLMPDLHSGKHMTCKAAGQEGLMKGLITAPQLASN